MQYVDAPARLTWVSPTSAAAQVTLWSPDGSELTPVPAVTSTGTEHAVTFTPTIPGVHRALWASADAAYATVVDVWPTDPRFIVSVEEAASTVGGFTAVANRDALGLLVAAATWMIEKIIGAPVLPIVHTHAASGGVESVLLPHMNVAVASVSVDGVALATDAFDVNSAAGVVYSASGMFPAGRRFNLSVVYTAGSAVVPANVRLATLDLVAHLWKSSRYSGRPSDASPAADTIATPWGFAVPKRVVELCSATPATPGFG